MKPNVIIAFFLGFFFAVIIVLSIFIAPSGYGVFKYELNQSGAETFTSLMGLSQQQGNFRLLCFRKADSYQMMSTIFSEELIMEMNVVRETERLGIGHSVKREDDLTEIESASFSVNYPSEKFNFIEKKMGDIDFKIYDLQKKPTYVKQGRHITLKP